MTGNYTLNSVDLVLNSFTPGARSKLALSIYSDAGSKPGSDLYDLSTDVTATTLGSPPDDVNLTGTGAFHLVAGTKYWLDFYATNPGSSTGNEVTWDGAVTPSFAGATPTGPGATEIGQERSVGLGNPPSGPPSINELRTAFQLNGVAVPEPSSIALAAIFSAGALIFASRRRR
jgi:hypothetical protein